jgi:hypothetical protein
MRARSLLTAVSKAGGDRVSQVTTSINLQRHTPSFGVLLIPQRPYIFLCAPVTAVTDFAIGNFMVFFFFFKSGKIHLISANE